MKTSHALTLTAVSLSLALCACDKGDKSSGPIPMPEASPKPPKTTKTTDGEAKNNPPPPESTEPAKSMNATAAPGAPTGAEEPNFEKFSQVDMINNALTLYATKQRQSSSMSGQMAAAGRGGMKKDANGNYPDPSKMGGKSGGSAGVTSLDQLVTAGVLKAIPAPPEGKKYVLDVKAQTVRLENK